MQYETENAIGISSTLRENRATLAVGFAIALILAAVLALMPSPQGQGPLEVRIHDGDGGTQTFSLQQDAAVSVRTSLGTNIVQIEDGAVRIIEADCPNGDCLRQQAITQPGEQLICLPHRLWVEVVPAGEQDGTMDESAVHSDDGDAGVDAVSR